MLLVRNAAINDWELVLKVDLICLLLVAARRRGQSRVRSSGFRGQLWRKWHTSGFPLFQTSTRTPCTDWIKRTIDRCEIFHFYPRGTSTSLVIWEKHLLSARREEKSTRFLFVIFISPRGRLIFISLLGNATFLSPQDEVLRPPRSPPFSFRFSLSHHAHPVVVCIKWTIRAFNIRKWSYAPELIIFACGTGDLLWALVALITTVKSTKKRFTAERRAAW